MVQTHETSMTSSKTRFTERSESSGIYRTQRRKEGKSSGGQRRGGTSATWNGKSNDWHERRWIHRPSSPSSTRSRKEFRHSRACHKRNSKMFYGKFQMISSRHSGVPQTPSTQRGN